MDMDKGRNLKSRERIEVCSTGVVFFSFLGVDKQGRGKMGTHKGRFTGQDVGS